MADTEDFVEVNVQPVGNDSAFGIELNVQDSTLNPNPFTIILGFQLAEGEIPGLNDDATSDPEQLIDLAKGLLLCDSDAVPEFGMIPADECPAGHKGISYDLDIEMELETETGQEVREQQWEVCIFSSPTQTSIDNERLFLMIQEFFKNHL